MTSSSNTDINATVPSSAEMRSWLVLARIADRAVTVNDVAALVTQVPKAQLRQTLDGLHGAVKVFVALANLCADGHEIFGRAEAQSDLRLVRAGTT